MTVIDLPSMNDSGPSQTEQILASIVTGLKTKGDATSIALLIEATIDVSVEQYGFDDFVNEMRLSLPAHVFFSIDDNERRRVENSIRSVASHFFKDSVPLNSVSFRPKLDENTETWRADATALVKGGGITNQGRVRSDNIAAVEHRGLLFRSKTETVLADALFKAKIIFSPLPVFVSKPRIEPDFVIIHKGLIFIVEVDGDRWHKESPADAGKRLIPLTSMGVEVHRIKAGDLKSAAAADEEVRKLVEFMDARKGAR